MIPSPVQGADPLYEIDKLIERLREIDVSESWRANDDEEDDEDEDEDKDKDKEHDEEAVIREPDE